MNLRQRGADMLNRRLGTAAAVWVVYSRGPASVGIAAVPGLTQTQSTRPDGVPGRTDFTERDYLFPAAALDFGLGAFEPRAGDTITETVAGLPVAFELAPSAVEPAWRWADHSRTRYRVHCKRID